MKNKTAIWTLLILFLVGNSWLVVGKNTPRLAELTKSDPLFYIHSIDTENLRIEIDALASSHKELLMEIKARAQSEVATEQLLRMANDGFLPINYLSSLPRTIETNGIFLSEPTFVNALKMLRAYFRSATAYQSAGETLYNTVAIGGALKEGQFIIRNIGSETKAGVLEHDFALIKDNGLELMQEVRKRTMCLIIGLNCSSHKLPNIFQTSQEIAHRSTPVALSNEALEEIVTKGERYGPYLVNSACFSSTPLWMYVYFDEKYGFLPKQIDDNYYIDFSKRASGRSKTYTKRYLDQGIGLLAQPEGANYRCTDLRYWGNLSTLVYFDTLFPNENIQTLADIDGLISVNNLEPRYISQNKLVYLPNMLHNITAFLAPYKRDSKDFTIEPLYLVGLRSSYSVTFQTFSRSFWRLDEQPTYVSRSNLPIPDTFTTYKELEQLD